MTQRPEADQIGFWRGHTFVNIQSVDRIVYAIFNRFNLDWQKPTLSLFTHAA